MRIALLTAVLLLVTAPAIGVPSEAAELRITLTDLRSGEGKLRVALFRTPEDFPKPGGLFREVVVPAGAGPVDAVFAELPPGTYGVAAFHDENDNGKFDRNVFGIPREGYGFANNPPVRLGPPKFSDASVSINGETVRTDVKMRYWIR